MGFSVSEVKDIQNTRPIYMDMQATSPTDPRVLDAMLPYMTELYGNPHSRTHSYGWETEKGVDQAREVTTYTGLGWSGTTAPTMPIVNSCLISTIR